MIYVYLLLKSGRSHDNFLLFYFIRLTSTDKALNLGSEQKAGLLMLDTYWYIFRYCTPRRLEKIREKRMK